MQDLVHASPLAANSTSLRAFLARLIWTCVLPPLLLATYLAFDSVRTVRSNQDLEAANLARNVAATIDQSLTARVRGLQLLAASPLAGDPSRWNELHAQALGFRESFGSHVILSDLDLRMRLNTRVPFGAPLPPLPRPEGRAAAPTALKTARPAIGDVFVSPLTQRPLVAIAVPGLREGRVAFILLTILETEELQNQLDQAALPGGWRLSLRDGAGVEIARRGIPAAAAAEPGRRFVAPSIDSPWSVALEIPRDLHDAPILSAALTLAIAMLGMTLVALLGGLRAARRLAAAVSSLAHPVRSPNVAEIAEIAAVRRLLDESARQRESAEEQVRALNADLEARVAQRTAQLEDAHRELRAFDYSVSHDLRAPLNRIRSFGDALLDTCCDSIPAEGRELVKRIQAAGEAADRMVTDMLSLSTIATGEVHRSDVDLSAMARRILESFQRADPDRDIEIVVAPGVRANADPGLIRIALENLLANAWKFTAKQANARIEFGSEGDVGDIHFFVRDNGVGFDAQNAGRLFQPFRRLHAQSEFPGNGTGLATVRRIVSRHGGRIWAQGSVGSGATFRFTTAAP